MLIPEQSKWKSAFDLIILFFAVYSTFTSAFYSAFGFTSRPYLVVFTIIIEVTFLIDIILTFFQEYISEEDYQPVRSFRSIALRYIKRSFIFDIVALFPFQLFSSTDAFQQNVLLLKLFRMPKMFMLLNERHFRNILKRYYNHRL